MIHTLAKQKVPFLKVINYTIIGTQTQPATEDIGTQCNLLNAPPLQRLQPVVSLDDSIATETETETDLDTSFCSNREDYTTE